MHLVTILETSTVELNSNQNWIPAPLRIPSFTKFHQYYTYWCVHSFYLGVCNKIWIFFLLYFIFFPCVRLCILVWPTTNKISINILGCPTWTLQGLSVLLPFIHLSKCKLFNLRVRNKLGWLILSSPQSCELLFVPLHSLTPACATAMLRF